MAGSDVSDAIGLEQLDRLEGDAKIVFEARLRWNRAQSHESTMRDRGDEDEKFHHGDSKNRYQWPDQLYSERDAADRPALTINKAREHNLQIINDGKQNKPGVNIRPTGDGATYKAAQTFQSVILHIEYESAAEHIYDQGLSQCVIRGLGYWRGLPVWGKEEGV